MAERFLSEMQVTLARSFDTSRNSSPSVEASSLFFLALRPPPTSPLFPYTTLFRSIAFDADPKFFACLVRFESSSVPTKTQSERSEERFSRNAETDLVCRLLLAKKNRQVFKPRLRIALAGRSQIYHSNEFFRSIALQE